MNFPPRNLLCALAASLGLAFVLLNEAAVVDGQVPPPTLFVSPGGADTNTGLSPAAPLLGFDRAYQLAQPGQVVGVAAGTYNGDQTIRNDPTHTSPEDVVFRSKGTVHLDHTSDSFAILGDHITFEGPGFVFDRVQLLSSVATGGSDDITFLRTQIHTMAVSGGSNGLNLYENEMGPNTTPFAPGSAPDDILYYGSSGAINTGVNIVGNRFHDGLKSRPTSHTDCLQFTGGQDVLIARNTFDNCENLGIIIKGDKGPLNNFDVENNYLETPSGSSGSALQLVGSTPCTPGCSVRNNSVAGGGTIRISAGGPNQDSTGPSAGAVYHGNLSGKEGSSTDCKDAIAGGWDFNYNAFYGAAGITCGANVTNLSAEDPGWVGAPNLDLHLLRASAVRDRGHPSSYPSTDIDGEPRKSGAAPDAGADEVDVEAPRLSVLGRRVRRGLKRRIDVVVRCNERCALVASGGLKLGKRRFKLVGVRSALGDGASRRMRLKVRRRSYKSASKRLRKRRRGSAVIKLRATDAAGNAASTRVKLRIKPKPKPKPKPRAKRKR